MNLLDDIDYNDDESFTLDEITNLSDDEEEIALEDAEEGEQEQPEEDDDNSEEEGTDTEEPDGEDAPEGEEEEDVSFTPFIENLIDKGILEWDGETEYDDSDEGFAQIVKDNLEKGVQNIISGLSPKAQKLMEIEMAGGDIEEAFRKFEEVDYESVDISDEDVAKSLIKDYYKATNPKWNDDRIKTQLEMLEDSGILSDEASLAKEYFSEKTAADRETYLRDVKAQQEQEEKQYHEELNAYTKIIDDGEGFNGLKFTNRQEKEAFKKYVFERGDDGMTQAERDDQDRSTRLAKEFYKFRKFNFEDVERKVTTTKSIALKKQLQRFTDKNSKSNRTDSTRSNSKDSGKFSLGSIID